jgi:D-inositol-3-phosphate glycosyltransferase
MKPLLHSDRPNVGIVFNPLWQFAPSLDQKQAKIVSANVGQTNGSRVAAASLIQMLLQHQVLGRPLLFCHPLLLGSAETLLQDSIARSGGSIVDARELTLRPSAVNLGGWYEPTHNWHAGLDYRNSVSKSIFPVMSTIHSVSYSNLLYDWVLRTLLSTTYACDALICTSKAALQAVKNLFEHVQKCLRRRVTMKCNFNGAFCHIPLSIDTERFKPMARAHARQQLGLPEQGYILLSMARFSVSDKCDLGPMLQMLSDMPSPRQVPVLLILAGADVKGNAAIITGHAVSMGLGNRVKVITNVDPSMLPYLYSSADLFISLSDSIQESFGLTTVEAMACGVPQVVSDWNGHKDTVLNGETGFTVPTYWTKCDEDLQLTGLILGWDYDHLLLSQSVAVDLTVLHARVLTLLENDELRAKMSANSRVRAVQLFSHSVVARGYEQLRADLGVAARRTKAVAQSDCLAPAYCKSFGHYPTGFVTDETILALTAVGRSPLTDNMFGPHREIFKLRILDHQILKALLSVAAKGEDTMQNIANQIGKNTPNVVIYRHVMWLLKYGLLEAKIRSCDHE